MGYAETIAVKDQDLRRTEARHAAQERRMLEDVDRAGQAAEQAESGFAKEQHRRARSEEAAAKTLEAGREQLRETQEMAQQMERELREQLAWPRQKAMRSHSWSAAGTCKRGCRTKGRAGGDAPVAGSSARYQAKLDEGKPRAKSRAGPRDPRAARQSERPPRLQAVQELLDHRYAVVEAWRVVQRGDGVKRSAQCGMRVPDLVQEWRPMTQQERRGRQKLLGLALDHERKVERSRAVARSPRITAGSYADKSLDKFFTRFEGKVEQDRLQFLFGPAADTATLEGTLKSLIGYGDKQSNVTIVNWRGVPFEVLSITVPLISRIVFEYGYHSKVMRTAASEKSNTDAPILLVYEEAHK